MSVVPVVHADVSLRTAIRRSLPRRGVKMVSCKTVERAEIELHRSLVDAIVIDVLAFGLERALAIVERFPGIPVFALSKFRPDDGCVIAECLDGGVSGILVQGVDDGIVGEILMSHSANRARIAALASGPHLLRLTEPLQTAAWNEVLSSVGRPTTTSDIARRLGHTREYISREFAAGGAPNLKRVIDLVRTAWAADLLKNPGYTVRIVSEILKFSSPSHLGGCSKRVAGVAATDLASLGPHGVLQRFRRGRTRSRL